MDRQQPEDDPKIEEDHDEALKLIERSLLQVVLSPSWEARFRHISSPLSRVQGARLTSSPPEISCIARLANASTAFRSSAAGPRRVLYIAGCGAGYPAHRFFLRFFINPSICGYVSQS